MDILICESFKLIICYYVEDIIHLSCVIFTDEHNYAQLTETEDVICDMTPDRGGLKYTCPLNILRMVVLFKC
jgi:hypothetical protein